MHRLSVVLGSLFLAVTHAQAELIIHSQRTATSTSSPALSTSNPTLSSAPVAPQFNPQNNFQACISNLRSPDYSVIEKLNYQPEFSTPIWDYLSGLVDEERVAAGKQKLAQHHDVLSRASSVYGVPVETIFAVRGVVSNF